MAPLQDAAFRLAFANGKRGPWAKSFRGLRMVGGEPLLPPSGPAHDALFRAIRQTFPNCDCLSLDQVRLDSFLWDYFSESQEIREFWHPYLPHRGPARHHWLLLPSTFADYLAKFGGKTRQTVKRQVNLLRRHGSGSLELRRVGSRCQVDEFVEQALAIATRSWQQRFLDLPLETACDRARSLRELADDNLLRAYLLYCGGRPCAYAIGLQLEATCVFYETAYDPGYAHRSPGKVLLYLMIEDLFNHNKPRRLSFCSGEMPYKALFGTSVSLEADLVLFRRTAANRAWCLSHKLFRGVVNQAYMVPAARRLLAAVRTRDRRTTRSTGCPGCPGAPAERGQEME